MCIVYIYIVYIWWSYVYEKSYDSVVEKGGTMDKSTSSISAVISSVMVHISTVYSIVASDPPAIPYFINSDCNI